MRINVFNNVGLQCTLVNQDSSWWGWQVVHCCWSSDVDHAASFDAFGGWTGL